MYSLKKYAHTLIAYMRAPGILVLLIITALSVQYFKPWNTFVLQINIVLRVFGGILSSATIFFFGGTSSQHFVLTFHCE